MDYWRFSVALVPTFYYMCGCRNSESNSLVIEKGRAMMDYSAFDDFVEDDSPEEKATLEYIAKIGEEAQALSVAMQELQDEIDALNTRFRHITEKEMPRCLGELGMRKFTLTDGTEFVIKDIIQGNLNNAPDKNFARQWCIDNGFDELFTTDVSVKFPKGGHNEALDVKASLEERGLAVDFKEGIHHATFSSELRKKHAEYLEMTENGIVCDPIPFAELGAYQGTKAEIKKKKK